MKKYLLLFILMLSLNAATSTWKVRDSDGDTTFVSSDGHIYHSGDTLFFDDMIKVVSGNDTLLFYPLGIYANDTLELNTSFTDILGKLIAGSFGSPIDVGSARKYGVELHYSGDNNDATALRARAQAKTTDAPTKTMQGAEIQASNNDGISVSVLNGLIAEALSKSSSTAARIGTMRAALFGIDIEAKDTITNAYVVHIRGHTRDATGDGTIDGDGYLLLLENEAVGGNGQAFDAGIKFKGTNISGGNSAFKYGIDFTGATYDSAEIRLSDGTLLPGGYRSEARVDTLNMMYLRAHTYTFSNGVNLTKSWQMNSLYAYGLLQFNSAGDYFMTPLWLQGDSAFIDSIAWHYGWTGTPPDADTIYCIYSDSTGWSNDFPVYYFTIVDTIGASEIVKDTYGEKITMTINEGYSLGSLEDGNRNPTIAIEYEKETGVGVFNWTAIIIYWTKFTRR